MINILHPTVFSLTDCFESSSRRWCLTHLEFLAKFGIVSTLLLDRFAANKSRFAVTVISCDDKVNASVYTDNIADVRKFAFFDIIGYWDMKKYFPCFFESLAVPKR